MAFIYGALRIRGNKMGKVTSERGNFLTKKQKELKQQIMHDLINSMFKRFQDNKIEEQVFTDIFTSCLVMFTRELLNHATNQMPEDCKSSYVDEILSVIKNEVLGAKNN